MLRSTKPADSGFTLLELLIAIAIASLLSVLGSLWIPGVFDRLAVSKAALVVDRTIAETAHLAEQTGSDRRLEFDTGGRHLVVRAGNRTIPVDPSISATWTAATEAQSTSISGAVVFFGTGGSSGGALTLGRGRAHTTLIIDWLTGRPTEETRTIP